MNELFGTMPMEQAVEGWIEEVRGRGGRAASARGRPAARRTQGSAWPQRPRRRRRHPWIFHPDTAPATEPVDVEPGADGDGDAGGDAAGDDGGAGTEPGAPGEPPAGPAPEGGESEWFTTQGPIVAKLGRWRTGPIEDAARMAGGACRIDGKPTAGGLYLVELRGKPIYVGESDNLRGRWLSRLRDALQVGLLPVPAEGRPAPLYVSFANIVPNTRAARKAAEHALIRTLINHGLATTGGLRNSHAKKQFELVSPLRIEGLLPPHLRVRLGRLVKEKGGAADPRVRRLIEQNVLDLAGQVRYER